MNLLKWSAVSLVVYSVLSLDVSPARSDMFQDFANSLPCVSLTGNCDEVTTDIGAEVKSSEQRPTLVLVEGRGVNPNSMNTQENGIARLPYRHGEISTTRAASTAYLALPQSTQAVRNFLGDPNGYNTSYWMYYPITDGRTLVAVVKEGYVVKFGWN